MGLAIDREHFEPEDYARFDERLDRCLRALAALLERPDFGAGPPSVGAELELSLVDRHARPLPLNLRVLDETLDPRLTFELDRFNLECNLRHTGLAGRPFETLGREITDAVAEVRRAAAPHGGRIAMIGILPTLRADDLQSSAMTDTPRYRALSAALAAGRPGPFLLRIDGVDPLEVTCNDVTFEGAATSLQIHLRVAARDFSRVFNAAQLATAPVLAAAGNSPSLLGHRLWQETRVALFQQAVDDRGALGRELGHEARVSFGRNWVRDGALELFSQSASLHRVLLPVLGDEDPLDCLAGGGIPRLDEVRLHQGTVWSWNRPIYDPADGGHLRIEMRALPAGPSVVDMLANTAWLVGLTLGLAADADSITASLPFDVAHDNFYRAARHGLAAELTWPRPEGGTRTARADRLVPTLLPVARSGLASAGVEADDVEALLDVIVERCGAGRTGSVWQSDTWAHFERATSRESALAAMLERYLECSRSGEPVHRWPTPDAR